jgi:hypothetical protein
MTRPATLRLLGHTFKLMDEDDYESFAGAEPNSYIFYSEDEEHDEDPVLIASQSADGSRWVVQEIHMDSTARNWTGEWL